VKGIERIPQGRATVELTDLTRAGEEVTFMSGAPAEPTHEDTPPTPAGMRVVLAASLGVEPEDLMGMSEDAVEIAYKRLNELVRRLSELAATDELTGLMRRGSGYAAAHTEITRTRRGDGRLVLVVVDVDGLKAVNDNWGHLAGDKLLRAVADCLKESLRPYDIIIRFGGDEFLCVLSGVTRDQVEPRLDLILESISARTRGQSVSFGLAELQGDDSIDDLIARADAELYARRREVRGQSEATG
jgi:diguanylate cyclase (GGDEF)-like protein